MNDITKTFESNYTYKMEKTGALGHIRYFQCHKCKELVDEFLLYAHLEDHKNPEAVFGKKALERLIGLGMPLHKMEELGFTINYKEWLEDDEE